MEEKFSGKNLKRDDFVLKEETTNIWFNYDENGKKVNLAESLKNNSNKSKSINDAELRNETKLEIVKKMSKKDNFKKVIDDFARS